MSDVAIAAGLAKVVHVSSDDELVINWGADDGVKRGDVFLVYGRGPLITDPDTGKDLGRLELVRGRGEVVHVQASIATLRSLERRSGRLLRRLVKEARGGAAWLPAQIEEEFPSDEETRLPFNRPEIGDLARPV